MCCRLIRKFLLGLRTKPDYLYVLLALTFFLIIVIAVGFWIFTAYDYNNKEIEDLKWTEDDVRPRSSEGKDDADPERVASKIKAKEYYANWLYVGKVFFVALFILILVLMLLVALCKALFMIFRQLEDYVMMYGMRQCCPSCNLQELCSCSRSDEDSISQIARDVSANFNRAAPESVVFRGTRNTEGGDQQEASDLPGVPSTSNN